jgi:hypothetical protein
MHQQRIRFRRWRLVVRGRPPDHRGYQEEDDSNTPKSAVANASLSLVSSFPENSIEQFGTEIRRSGLRQDIL